MFSQHQMNEVWPLVEISYTTATVSPGAVSSATPVGVSAACSLGTPLGGGTSPATFALGDTLEVVPPAGAATNGLTVVGAPTATQGTCEIVFINYTGSSVTPVAGIYKIIAKRIAANIVS
jgi:hypothetical protein